MTEQLIHPQTRLPRALLPFRHSSYRRLGAALILGTFAQGVWVVALVWEVIRIGGGPGELSIVTTAGAVGLIVPALLGGVVADRVPQKRILQAVATVETVAMASTGLLSAADLTQVWHLAMISFVTGVAMAFYYPAYTAWLPALVPDEDLLAVNGFEGMIRPALGNAIGPGVAGVVVGAATSSAALGVAAASNLAGLFVLGLVPLTAVRRDNVPESEGARAAIGSALTDVREGFSYMVRTPWLLATLLFASVMVFAVMGPLEVLVPFLVKDKLGGGADDHAMVLAAFGIGGAAGSLAMASIRMPRRYLTTMNLTWGLGCLPFLLVAWAPNLFVVVLGAGIVGVLFSAPMVIWGTLLQQRVPPHLLGRVASLDFFVSISLMPISMAVAGPVSQAIGVGTTFVVAAVLPGIAATLAVVLAKLPADEMAHPLS